MDISMFKIKEMPMEVLNGFLQYPYLVTEEELREIIAEKAKRL